MNRRSILAAYKKKSSHFQTGVTGFKSGNLFSFGLIEKYRYQSHRVLTQEKPHELMMKFYSPARSCTQTLLHAIPTRRPCHREKRPCLGRFAAYRRGARPAKCCPNPPLSGAFCPRMAFPVQALPVQGKACTNKY